VEVDAFVLVRKSFVGTTKSAIEGFILGQKVSKSRKKCNLKFFFWSKKTSFDFQNLKKVMQKRGFASRVYCTNP